MSCMKCKRVKNNHDGTITINITENNVHPADWRDYTIKSDDKGLAQDKLVTLMYYGDVQLQASAKKYGLGKAIEKAIELAGGRKWACDDDGKKIVEVANQVIKAFNYDDSNSMVDYFDTNFYYNLKVEWK